MLCDLVSEWLVVVEVVLAVKLGRRRLADRTEADRVSPSASPRPLVDIERGTGGHTTWQLSARAVSRPCLTGCRESV